MLAESEDDSTTEEIHTRTNQHRVFSFTNNPDVNDNSEDNYGKILLELI